MKRNRPYNLESIGLRLKNVRQSLDLTQDQLGSKLDLSKTTICDYEVGKTPPGFDFLFKLANLFNVNIDFILCGEGPVFKDKNQFPQPQPGEKLFGDFDGEVAKILDYMRKSSMVLLAVVTMALEYIDKNKKLIDNCIKLETAKKEDKVPGGKNSTLVCESAGKLITL